MNRELAGTIAGFVATAPMTVAMTALHLALPSHEQDPPPPQQIVENAAEAVGVDLGDEETVEKVTLAAHFGYGASVGALYGQVAGATGLPRAAEGMLYGLAVWGGGYLGAMPGVGLYRSPDNESAARHGMMIAAHLVWGATLGVVVGLLASDSYEP